MLEQLVKKMNHIEYIKKKVKNCGYVILKEDIFKNEMIILLENTSNKTTEIFIDENKNKYLIYFIQSGKGFLDIKWEQDILKERKIKNGLYYPDEKNKIYLDIYIEEMYEPIFRYFKKKEIAEKINPNQKCTYKDLMIKLQINK